jgi:SAM-dependent methyltransferase
MSVLLTFARLAKKRLRSPEDYREFQKFQADQIFVRCELIRNAITKKIVLDLGSGETGYASELSNYARLVCSVDINIRGETRAKVAPVKADALKLPFGDNSFDFCFCSSLIEHIGDQRGLLEEIHRILKPDSLCYLSFPPFYSPVGGHQFKPFHYLPEKLCLAICKKIRRIDCNSYSKSFGSWGLYPTTMRNIKKLAKGVDFKIDRITTRISPLNFTKIPFFGEILTWHVEFILRKAVKD